MKDSKNINDYGKENPKNVMSDKASSSKTLSLLVRKQNERYDKEMIELTKQMVNTELKQITPR